MTLQDFQLGTAGYYQNSNYPVECGGVRRQKHARSPGLNIQPNERLAITSRQFSAGRWVIATFDVDGRLFVFGCSTPGQPDVSFGWVEEVDPNTLETINTSPELATGGHNWCGGAGVLTDGTIITGFGRYIHKLNLDLELVAEMELPVDQAHNGVMRLSDGMMVTRSMEHDPSRNSVFTLFDPGNLECLDTFEFVGSSIGRFCIDPGKDWDSLYATTPTHVHRLIYKDRHLSMDPNWSACYDLPGEDQGFAWCNTVGDDSVWFMDMGDLPPVESMMRAYPVGTKPIAFSPLNQAPLRVHRVSTHDSSSSDVLTPFGLPAGGQAASALYVQDKSILMAFDTLNRKTGAWRFNGAGDFTELWVRDIANSNQALYYPDTGEVILDDVLADQSVDAVVVDLETGLEKGRVATGTLFAAGMMACPGFERDFYVASGVHGALCRVYVSET
jgi:hypothetical protein